MSPSHELDGVSARRNRFFVSRWPRTRTREGLPSCQRTNACPPRSARPAGWVPKPAARQPHLGLGNPEPPLSRLDRQPRHVGNPDGAKKVQTRVLTLLPFFFFFFCIFYAKSGWIGVGVNPPPPPSCPGGRRRTAQGLP